MTDVSQQDLGERPPRDRRRPARRRADTARLVGFAGALPLLAASACGPAAPDPAPAPEPQRLELPAIPTPLLAGNWLRNPGFEEGDAGWGELAGGKPWIRFRVVESPVYAGEGAARLRVSWQPGEPQAPVRVFGAAQDLTPPRFPDRLAGYYRVERWENESPETDLYLQAVVIVKGDPRARRLIAPDDPDSLNPELDNYQMRYVLAGLEEPPFIITNGRIVLVQKGPPVMGEWVRFELPVKRDFAERWGVVPADYEWLRVYFEARWDNKEPGAAVRADVYYDDLFFGFDDPPAS